MDKITKTVVGIAIMLGIVLVVTFGMSFNGNVVSEETIKIGVVAPLTGGPAIWGQASVNLIQIAVDEINSQGGVEGRQIELIVEDGLCKPQPAVTSAKKLIDIDGVKFLLGGHCSPETVGIVPIVDESGIFLLAGMTAADDAVSESDYAFRTSPPTIEQAEQVSNTAYYKYGFKRIALITEEAAYSRSFTKDIEETFPGDIVFELNYAPGERDFRGGLAKIKDLDVDAIWVSPQEPNAASRILKQMEELDMIETKLFGNIVFISGANYRVSGGLLPSDAFTITPFVDPNDKESKVLQNKYLERYGEEIPYNLYYTTASYDATYMLVEAIRECGEDVSCVQNWFDEVEDWEGAAGDFTFKENGDPVFDSWRELRIVDGKEVIVGN
jgi:branched-chain amino acid transport system substrate-binding protein